MSCINIHEDVFVLKTNLETTVKVLEVWCSGGRAESNHEVEVWSSGADQG